MLFSKSDKFAKDAMLSYLPGYAFFLFLGAFDVKIGISFCLSKKNLAATENFELI